MPVKVIVVGGCEGQYPVVFKKLSTLQAKNSFSLGIFLGDFFADADKFTEEDESNLAQLLDGSIRPAFPIYFTLGQRRLPAKVVERLSSSGNELCENVQFLGKRSTLKTSDGIRIVALGGRRETDGAEASSKDGYAPVHSESDVKVLRGANSADILLTSSWPAAVRSGSRIPLPEGEQEPAGEAGISELCATLRPRYHFSVSANVFFEREPFFQPAREQRPEVRPVTRFISLASYGNGKKQKWLYAFNLDPSEATAQPAPPGTTASPFAGTASSRKRATGSEDGRGYSRYAAPSKHQQHRPAKRSRQPPPGPDQCFFCLSNANLATHLITSIADDAYLTTARGPLARSTTFPSLSFPAHILIIPLAHSPTLSSIAEAATRDSTFAEMTRYRRALQSMVQAVGDGKLGAVTWEVSRMAGIHTHWQFLPVDAAMAREGLVEAAFRVEGENERYPAFEEGEREASDPQDFFRVWIWTGRDSAGQNSAGSEKSLVLPLDVSVRFDVNFGRRVLAKLLGLEGRTNWKDCLQSVDEETADVEAFKRAFKPFDFAE